MEVTTGEAHEGKHNNEFNRTCFRVLGMFILGEQNYFGYGIFVTLCVSFKYDVYWKVDGGYIKQKKNLGKKGQ